MYLMHFGAPESMPDYMGLTLRGLAYLICLPPPNPGSTIWGVRLRRFVYLIFFFPGGQVPSLSQTPHLYNRDLGKTLAKIPQDI